MHINPIQVQILRLGIQKPQCISFLKHVHITRKPQYIKGYGKTTNDIHI